MSSVRKRNGSRKTSTEEKGRDSSYSDVDRESDLDQVEDAGQDTPKPREPVSRTRYTVNTLFSERWLLSHVITFCFCSVT